MVCISFMSYHPRGTQSLSLYEVRIGQMCCSYGADITPRFQDLVIQCASAQKPQYVRSFKDVDSQGMVVSS